MFMDFNGFFMDQWIGLGEHLQQTGWIFRKKRGLIPQTHETVRFVIEV